MAITTVKNTFSTYALDDSVETKNYHRVLFKPGVSVQARELTELQTNLQRQIDYHGQYAFKEGERVVGGQVTLNVDYDYIKVESAFTNSDGTFTASDFITTIADTAGATLTNSNGVEAEVIQVISEAGVDLASASNKTGILDSGNTSDPLTLYVKYTKGSNSANSNTFAAGEFLTSSTNSSHKLMVGGGTDTDSGTGGNQNSTISSPVGKGSRVQINEGVYFISGNFVYVASDNLILEKYDNTPSNIIGLNITESVITSVDDTTLLDNATGFPNASAPGADRYKIGTQLIKEPLASPNSVFTNYIILLKVENGIQQVAVAATAKGPTELTQRLARRTNEESGNYALDKFVLDIKEHLDDGTNGGYLTSGNSGSDSKYVVGIEPNIAYVQGFRTENIATKFLTVDKPREASSAPLDYAVKPNATTKLDIGNYIKIDISDANASVGLPDITNFSELTLIDTSNNTTAIALVDSVSFSSSSTGAQAGTYFVTDGDTHTTGANGTGASFKIVIDEQDKVTVEVTDGGSGYQVNSSFTVLGTKFRSGATSGQDLTFDVASLGVGRARVKAVTQETSTVLRLYLFDIVVTKGTFDQVDKVEQLNTVTGGGANNDFFANLVGASDGIRYESDTNTAVFKLPFDGIKTAEYNDKPVYQLQKRLYVDDAGAADSTTFSNVLDADENLVGTTAIISVGSGAGTDLATVIGTASQPANSRNVVIGHDSIVDNSSVAAIITVQKTGNVSHKRTKTFNANTTATLYYDGTNPVLLNKYDIYKLVEVRQTNSTGPIITDQFDLDNGQRANYYDEGRLIPIGNVAAGDIYVKFHHYTHNGGEYLTRDSYPAESSTHKLKDIPTLKLPNGEVVDLKDCIDFRPVKSVTDVHSNVYSSINDSTFHTEDVSTFLKGVNAPAIAPGSILTFDAHVWMPRIDKLVLGRDGQYKIIKGVSSENPVPPEDPLDSMVIGLLRVKPFTYDAKSDVIPTLNDHKRYTMRQIGEIDKRVKNLEYYSALSLLESEALNISIPDTTSATNTFERFKNGIFAEPFKGHANASVTHPSYHCSVDKAMGVLRPKFDQQNVNLVRKTGDTGVVLNGSLFTLPFTSTAFITQSQATTTEFVNPYNVFTWAGTLELSPDTDEWKDVENRPDVIINDDGQFDQMVAMIEESGILGTVWNEWETNWTGVDRQVDTFRVGDEATWRWRRRRSGRWQQPGWVVGDVITTTRTGQQSRQGLQTTIVPDVETRELGSKVVETNYIPFIRSREIFFKAQMMKPNTKLYAYFNEVNVSNYCAEKTFVEFATTSGVTLQTNKTQHDESTRGQLTTDASGNIEGSFFIPNNSGLKFRTGVREFRLTDSSTNDRNSENTFAEANYFAQGLLEIKENTIISTKVPRVVTNEISENRAIFDRTVNDNTRVRWIDPLAQTFLIDKKGGLFATECDIFLAAADASIPLNVSIREVENGIPTQRIVPGSETVLFPSSNAASTINSNALVVGRRYKIKTVGGQDFTSVGAINSNVGTVFTATGTTTGSNAGKVDDVNTIYTGNANSMISTNGSVACPVVFKNPIYLSQDTEYAIVLISNSDKYKVFIAETGETDLISNARVAKQPYNGVFFTSQNASTWTPEQNRDLKFTLKRAEFTSSGATLAVNNDTLPVKSLKADPFRVASGSATNSAVLRVTHPNHGMHEGDSVTIAGAATFNTNITAAALNTNHTVTDVELDSYVITVTISGSPGTTGTFGGGSTVTASENMAIDALIPYNQSLELPETNITYTFRGYTGRSIDGPTTQNIFTETGPFPLSINNNNFFDNPIVIASSRNHAAGTGDLENSGNNIGTNKSFLLTCTFNTTNTALSPVIDMNRASLFCISNRTNAAKNTTDDNSGGTKYGDASQGRTYVDNTAAKGNSNLNNYITREITLANEAGHLNVYADIFRPSGSDIELYYKVKEAGDERAFDDIGWTLLSPTVAIPIKDADNSAVEYAVSLSDVSALPNTFSSFAFKVVLTTTNSSRPPLLRNFRAIATT